MMSGDPQDAGHRYIQTYASHHSQTGMVSRDQQDNRHAQAQSKECISYLVLFKSESVELEREHGKVADQKKG